MGPNYQSTGALYLPGAMLMSSFIPVNPYYCSTLFKNDLVSWKLSPLELLSLKTLAWGFCTSKCPLLVFMSASCSTWIVPFDRILLLDGRVVKVCLFESRLTKLEDGSCQLYPPGAVQKTKWVYYL